MCDQLDVRGVPYGELALRRRGTRAGRLRRRRRSSRLRLRRSFPDSVFRAQSSES